MLDIVSLCCNKLSERVKFFASQEFKDIPTDIHISLHTLIYCADRLDIDELGDIKQQIRQKFSDAYIKRADQDKDGCVNKAIIEKLTGNIDPHVIEVKLQNVAAEFN